MTRRLGILVLLAVGLLGWQGYQWWQTQHRVNRLEQVVAQNKVTLEGLPPIPNNNKTTSNAPPANVLGLIRESGSLQQATLDGPVREITFHIPHDQLAKILNRLGPGYTIQRLSLSPVDDSTLSVTLAVSSS